MNIDDYKEKIEILKKWAYQYYVLDEPIASDEEYDKLYRVIKEFEENNPEVADESSPVKRVGGFVLDGFEKHRICQECGRKKMFLILKN